MTGNIRLLQSTIFSVLTPITKKREEMGMHIKSFFQKRFSKNRILFYSMDSANLISSSLSMIPLIENSTSFLFRHTIMFDSS